VDCSGYIRNIYKCFGLELARNTTWQTAMPMEKMELQGMTTEERKVLLDTVPMGAILFFRGHEMMYLGTENGQYYVINSIGNIIDPMGSKNIQRISSIVVNTLDTRRGNGNTWLDELTTVIVPFGAMQMTE
jgi:cell wall-associated NlpC family hydrolase